MAYGSVQEIMDNIARLDSARIEGLNGVILFDLTGEGGGQWTVKIADGSVGVEEGVAAEPDMTVSMTAQDFLALSAGELNAMSAFMQGKIRVSGDMGLAMRLQSILT